MVFIQQSTLKRYSNYNILLKEEFAERVQKISINAGFTCPNRDGKKGYGGCTYCNNQTFVPGYCEPQKNITQQIKEGIAFFRHKYQTQKYIAYFQSYTNTYGGIEHLKSMYQEALSYSGVIGLVIGTRPDCVNDELLDYFSILNRQYYIMIEYGVESTKDSTLDFINRGHSYADAVQMITKTADRGIRTGVHLILGLPLETKDDIIQHAHNLSLLPITALKLHQLQIIRGTVMAKQYAAHPEWFKLMTAEEYVDVVIDFLEVLHPNIALERFISQSPKSYLIAPEWGLKNFEFVHKIEKRLSERDTWQGKKHKKR